MTILANVGETVPITLVLEDGNTAQFPQAEIYDEAGSATPTTVNLTHVANGYYRGTYAVTTAEKQTIVFVVYSDAGHTTESSVYSRTTDILVSDAIWDAPRAGVAGSFGEALQALLGIAGKANVRMDNFTYDVNGFLTSTRMRVFSSSAAASASTDGGTGEGEILTVNLTGVVDGTFNTLPGTVLGTL